MSEISRVLIVDDEEEAVEVLCDYLSDLGFNVKSALNGRDALSFLENGDFDLLILDLQMPHVNGEEVLNELQQKNSKIAVIVVTGYSDGGVTESRIREYGVAGYIEKPIDLNVLEREIERIRQSRN